MTIEETLQLVRKRLETLANPRVKEGMERYFKETIRSYGVPAPAVRVVAREIYKEVKPWPLAQRNRFCTELFRSGMFEEGAAAIYLYRYFKRSCHECEFRLFERWIDRYVDNWAWCDGVSSWLVHASLSNQPALLEEIPRWTESPKRWKRRAAAVSLVPFGRRGEQLEVIFDVARRLARDEDDMVQKGVGWLLKDTYPKRPTETVGFLRSVDPPFARLVLRIAAEKMTAAYRERVLGMRRSVR
jgi:3-methyladenine DNA glycosylase AlkD